MRATLEFNLPDDQDAFRHAAHATDLYRWLCDVQEHLRDRLKHGELGEEAERELEDVRDLLQSFTGMFDA